jgi:hypothetical protein
MGEWRGWMEWAAFGDAAIRFLFLNWAVHATCLLTAGLLVSALPRLRASIRHGVLAASLLLAAISPVFRLAPAPVRLPAPAWARGFTAPATPTAPGARNDGSTRIASGARSGLVQRGPAGQVREHAELITAAGGFLGWLLLLIWAALAAPRIAGLAFGACSVRRLLRGATPVDRGLVYDACGYGIGDIPVLEADAVTVPSVIGSAQSPHLAAARNGGVPRAAGAASRPAA